MASAANALEVLLDSMAEAYPELVLGERDVELLEASSRTG